MEEKEEGRNTVVIFDEEIRLRPKSEGTIIVYNTIQPGMFKTVKDRIKALKSDFKKKNIEIVPEYFTAFGPFDNIIRFDVDDFCLVNNLSSLPGINSQQIQCVYTVKRLPEKIDDEGKWKPFCTITQLKVQNYLMLGYGPEVEEAILDLLASCLKKYLEIDLEDKPEIAKDLDIELMATLGWDEYFIFMRSSRGFASLYKPVREKIRSLTLAELKPFLERRGYGFSPGDEYILEFKHLFLSSYTTPAYRMELSHDLQNYLKKHPEKRKAKVLVSNKEWSGNKELGDEFGIDQICVSTRLSVKPGHESRVRQIIEEVIGEIGNTEDPVSPEKIFSIGRYDIYPWLNQPISCKDFMILFELLWFSLSGNLQREDNYQDFLEKTQFYSSFTIISYIEEPGDIESRDEVNKEKPKKAKGEGAFLKKLETLRLGYGNNYKTIIKAFERDFLKIRVPTSIIIGLARIFSLFDSCIADRFTCDSFVEMYPFMKRLREIIDSVEESSDDPERLVFKTGKKVTSIVLPESESESEHDPLVKVFHSAIRRFYRGFIHRYLSSYPMMDKNETSIDFSGRLHRILSAITGMQNLMLDDLECHLKKGFNVISTYPNIRIHRGSFNISEANVFHLFHVEIFYKMMHEIMHTFIHGEQFTILWKDLDDAVKLAPLRIQEEEHDIIDMFFEEMVGDLFLLKNGFSGNFKLFSFFYWLLLIQSQKAVDSNIILRFLFVSVLEDEYHRELIFKKSLDKNYFYSEAPGIILEIIEVLIRNLEYPHEIEDNILAKIREIYRVAADDEDSDPYYILNAFIGFSPILKTIHPRAKELIKKYAYPKTDDDETIYKKMPLKPEAKDGKHQWSSIRLFRDVLKFVYQNRNHLVCENDNLLNFAPKEKHLRRKLLQYRIALINTLQWESLHWKRCILKEQNIDIPLLICEISGKEVPRG